MKVLVLLEDKAYVADAQDDCEVMVAQDGKNFDWFTTSKIVEKMAGCVYVRIAKSTKFQSVYGLPIFYVNATGKELTINRIIHELQSLKVELFPSIRLLDTLHYLKASMSEMDSQSFEGMKQANDIFERGDKKWKDSEEGTMFLFNQCFEMKKINESISGTIASIDGMIESVMASMQ